MSGEVVLLPVAAQIGLGAVAATGVGLVAAFATAALVSAIREQQRQQREAAAAQARLQQRKNAAWQAYQAAEQAHVEHLNTTRAQIRQQFAHLHLQDVVSPSDLTQPAQARGFLHSAPDIDVLIAEIQQIFQDTTGLLDAPASPLPRLQAQWQKFQQEQNLAQASSTQSKAEMLQNFRTTLKYSLQNWQNHLQQEQQSAQQRLVQIQALLENSFLHQSLAQELNATAENLLCREEWQNLHAHLLQAVEQRSITAAGLATLQQKQAQLQQRVDQAMQRQAVQTGLLQSLQQHLQGAGYVFLQQESPERFLWQIPGGERLRVFLSAELRLSFQVVHERTYASEAALSGAEQAFFHQQENRWCADVPQLLRGLAQDGFQYAMQFERHTPDSLIPIAVLETVDDLLNAEARQRRSEKPYFSAD